MFSVVIVRSGVADSARRQFDQPRKLQHAFDRYFGTSANSGINLNFIQTIGQMYFLQGEHIRLCDMMMKQFQTFVREKYHLASREMNEDFINTIALKSDIPFEHIKKIVGYEFLISRNSISEQTMVEFHHLLNHFYKNCK